MGKIEFGFCSPTADQSGHHHSFRFVPSGKLAAYIGVVGVCLDAFEEGGFAEVAFATIKDERYEGIELVLVQSGTEAVYEGFAALQVGSEELFGL